jgi:ribosome-associated protein
MDDMSNNNALEICNLLNERSATEVVGLDMGEQCSWASHLIIATVTSRVHMQGLSGTVKDKMVELGLEPRNSGKKSDETSWRIIDCGEIVVSLMDSEARDYYALEERWFEAELIFGERKN